MVAATRHAYADFFGWMARRKKTRDEMVRHGDIFARPEADFEM
jgi:hypothetical protein